MIGGIALLVCGYYVGIFFAIVSAVVLLIMIAILAVMFLSYLVWEGFQRLRGR